MFPQSYSLQGRRKSFRNVSNPSWNSELIETKYLTLTRRHWRCVQKPGQLLKTNESMLRFNTLITIPKLAKTQPGNAKRELFTKPHPTLWALFDPPSRPFQGLPAPISTRHLEFALHVLPLCLFDIHATRLTFFFGRLMLGSFAYRNSSNGGSWLHPKSTPTSRGDEMMLKM